MLDLNSKMQKAIIISILLILSVLSVTLLSPVLSSPQFHKDTLETIDGQKQQAIGLSVAIAGSSTALSTLPDDMASPIAEELADLSFPLFLIVCFLYLEKFLLTTFGWVSGSFLIPGTLLMAAGFIAFLKETYLVWAKKLFILTLAFMLVIPVGAKVSALIEETFAESINQTYHAASHLSDASTEEESSNAFFSFISGLKDNVMSLVDTAKNMLNTFVDAIAVLLITSCIIPVLTAFVFIQLINKAMNTEIQTHQIVGFIQAQNQKRRNSKRQKRLTEKHQASPDHEE